MVSKEQDNRLAWESSRTLGEMGESLAAEHLRKDGYRLVLANFQTPIGRNTRNSPVTGEIDLIGFDRDILCFIEVKTRSSDDFTGPLTSVDLRKQRQIIRAARAYRRIFGVNEIEHRYDVVTIVMRPGKPAEIEVIKGFWNESKFRKRSWSAGVSSYSDFWPGG